MKRIISAEPLSNHRLRLRYSDGVEGTVDMSAELGKEVFAAWSDPTHFAAVKIVHNGRALEWPGGTDLCADALYLEITGKRVEDVLTGYNREAAHA
jgi:hypothetical protein